MTTGGITIEGLPRISDGPDIEIQKLLFYYSFPNSLIMVYPKAIVIRVFSLYP